MKRLLIKIWRWINQSDRKEREAKARAAQETYIRVKMMVDFLDDMDEIRHKGY